MALTKTVTKLWPNKTGEDGRVKVGIHLVLADDGVTVVERDFTASYGGGHTISECQTKITQEAQAAIDRYKAEKAIYGAAAYTNAVAAIDAALNL